MKKDFSISLNFNDVPAFDKHLQNQSEVVENIEEIFDELDQEDPIPAVVMDLIQAKEKKRTKKTVKKSNGNAPRDIQALMSEIKKRLIEGEPDLLIAGDLDLGKAEYRKLKSRIYDQEVDNFIGKSAEEQYIDYCFEQRKCLNDLDEMIKGSPNNHNAMVGAIRAKSQIMEAMHKMGVSSGVIKQDTSFDREIAGIRMSDLDTKEMRDFLKNELRQLQHIIDKYGDGPMEEIIPSPLTDPNIKRMKQ